MKSTIDTWHLRYDPQTAHLFDQPEQPKERPFFVTLLRFTAKTAAVLATLAAIVAALAALNSLT